MTVKAIEKSETWKDVVQDALRRLGGQAHLRDINKLIRNHPKTRTNPTWEFTIRRVVREYAIFQPVPPNRSGVYRLVEQPEGAATPGKMTGKEHLDHSIAQGMLLALGRIYGYETYAPAPDRSSRRFQGQSLGAFTTVTDCSGFCAGPSLGRVRQIDAIWLTEDNQGPYPVYAFEVEHTTKVRAGLDRLVEIPERYPAGLFVVAPGAEERARFSKLVAGNRFRRFRSRLHFKDYPQLEELYNAAVKHEDSQAAFGVSLRNP